jgi:tRNA (adenine22-N1)-methyltransferase
MPLQELPARLSALLALLEPCTLLADIGTDHGLVPLTAVAQGKAGSAIGIDRDGPLAQARRNWLAAGQPANVAWVAGLGLAALAEWQPDALALAGLGAQTIIEVLESPRLGDRPTQVVLQPNTQPARIRHWARTNGWHLRDERLVLERGRYYAVLALVPGRGPDPLYAHPDFTAGELDQLGPLLARRLDEVTRAYYASQALRLAGLPGRQAEPWRRALVK